MRPFDNNGHTPRSADWNLAENLSRVSEKEILATVRRMCRELGLYNFHAPPDPRVPAGFPDLVIIGTRIIFRELKTEHGPLVPRQREIGELLLKAEQDWAVWRPSDLASGIISAELGSISDLGVI